ncbi:TetR/AcrR family transcriptional regulator [Salinarimonas rosea]|uniref:TetR/AcrR family transcriptional regulator n=1 Tax=Salinarimonas rosea TaxID=552063 RepID=UPI00041B7428|nr:TetR/AcrR family transcriptional regulator [Salinarimonas rosea]
MAQNAPRRGPGRPVDPRARAARRTHILASARRCFLARGFHAASTADISREAGVSVANLYQYFPSKEELVLAMVEEDLTGDLAFFAHLFGGADGFLASVEAAFAALAEAGRARDELGLRAEIFAEALRNPRVHEALARSQEKLLTALAERVAAAVARGEIALADGVAARDVAALLFTLADGVYSAGGLDILDGARAARCTRLLLARALTPAA